MLWAKQLLNYLSTWFGPLVQKPELMNSLTIEDRDQTDLRRSKPSSRTILLGEQPNPYYRLQQ